MLYKCLCERKTGKVIPIRTIGHYLARWGFTPQKPIRRAYGRNETNASGSIYEWPVKWNAITRPSGNLLILCSEFLRNNPTYTTAAQLDAVGHLLSSRLEGSSWHSASKCNVLMVDGSVRQVPYQLLSDNTRQWNGDLPWNRWMKRDPASPAY